MAPSVTVQTTVSYEKQEQVEPKKDVEEKEEYDMHDLNFKRDLVWLNIFLFVGLHSAALYALCFCLPFSKILTILYTTVNIFCSGWGITAGAHRYWAHRTYKANLPLRLILTYFNTMAFQNSIHEWSRDHRLHHKYSETNADPHNAKRGFWFSHIGWLCTRKHPLVKIKGKGIDMSDLEADPIVMFQKKYYYILMPLVCFVIPSVLPVWLWGETWHNAYFMNFFRYTFVLNVTWLVNSAAHLWGSHPYDKNINPAENKFVAYIAIGEGWHNYHHVFPWDYKTAELTKYAGNWTLAFIDFFANLGWAYDLKTVGDETIKKRIMRTGDGSHKGHVFGWTDKDMKLKDRNLATIINKSD